MTKIRFIFFAFLLSLLLICGCVKTVQQDVDLTQEIEKLLEAPAAEGDLVVVEGDLAVPNVPEVTAHLERISGPHHAFMQRSLDRSATWRQMIAGEIEAKNLPPGLIAVVLQESAFKAGAVSRTGAAGLWQFIPSTGRLFGLHRDAFVDERFDPADSTPAALDYLDQLYQQFGDWSLALAAYNWGKGALSRCIEANNGERNFWKLSRKGVVREETMNYVPAIYARLAIWRDPERFGFSIPPADPPVQFDLSPLTDIPGLEATCGLSPGEIENLNPHLISEYTPPYPFSGRVYVPAHALSSLEKLERLGHLGRLTGSPDSLRTVRRIEHSVKKGETLWSISRKYKTSVDSLLSYNGWTKPPSMKRGMTVIAFVPR